MDEQKQKSSLSSFEKGLKSTVRDDFWDSKSEAMIDKILRNICSDYDLGKFMYIRVLPHQPIANYVENTFIKAVDNRNHWMRFDFIFEESQSHTLLLVVEYDGPFHETDDQKERDQYKNGLCAALNVVVVRIKYNSLDVISDEEVRKKYEADIMRSLLKTYFLSLKQFGYEIDLKSQKNTSELKYKKLCEVYNNALFTCTNEKKKSFYVKMRKYIEEAYYEFVPSDKRKNELEDKKKKNSSKQSLLK